MSSRVCCCCRALFGVMGYYYKVNIDFSKITIVKRIFGVKF